MTSQRPTPREIRERVLPLVLRHGWNATAFQTLANGFAYFFERGRTVPGEGASENPHDETCTAYVDTGSAWVAAGAPFADDEHIADAAFAFVDAARAQGKRACFFATEERFVAATRARLHSVRIGEQAVWDPREWHAILAGHKSLREQLRRARAKGVRVREVRREELEDGPTREAIGLVARRWLSSRSMAPMGFLVRCDPFSGLSHRVCFVAESGNTILGFASVIPVPARGGWFVEHLVRSPSAPNGTAELLVDAVMRWAGAENAAWLTLGLSPLSGEVSEFLGLARRFAGSLYDFEGLRRYKEKLRPHTWAPIFLSYPRERHAAIAFADSLAAFTHGGFLRFGAASLLRGPLVVLRTLAVLLVPWTMLLALAEPRHWFGSPWVKWAWVVFDVIVAIALFRIVRKASIAAVTALAVAVTSDAALTVTQALVWNLPHRRSLLDAFVTVVACAAPLSAAVILWGARHRLLQALDPGHLEPGPAARDPS